MLHNGNSIRPFIGSKDFNVSRRFYTDLGFKETVLSHDMSAFVSGNLSFYLQNAYVKDWVDNTMVFMEVDNVLRFYKDLVTLDLPTKYEGVQIKPIVHLDWGCECFVHDPSGVLWHFGEFKKS